MLRLLVLLPSAAVPLLLFDATSDGTVYILDSQAVEIRAFDERG